MSEGPVEIGDNPFVTHTEKMNMTWSKQFIGRPVWQIELEVFARWSAGVKCYAL